MNIFNRMVIMSSISFCNFVYAMDIDQQLIYATIDENAEQVQNLLAAGADVDARNGNGYTPLHMAAIYGQEAVVKFLLTHNASVDATNEDGRTPLHCAARYSQKAAAKLIERWPAYQELLRESQKKNLAFCCAKHPRLGVISPARVLPRELFQYICALAKPTIEDVATK